LVQRARLDHSVPAAYNDCRGWGVQGNGPSTAWQQ